MKNNNKKYRIGITGWTAVIRRDMEPVLLKRIKMNVDDLPRCEAKKALEFPHFPTRLQSVVWRNWRPVTVEKLYEIAGSHSCYRFRWHRISDKKS